MVQQILKLLISRFQAHAAPAPTNAQELGKFEGIGPLGGEDFNFGNIDDALGIFMTVLSTIIGVMTIIAFIWFVFTLFIGAIAWLGSGGDKTKLQKAQGQITTGLIGLVIVISATFLLKLIGEIFGIPDILNIARWIKDLGQK